MVIQRDSTSEGFIAEFLASRFLCLTNHRIRKKFGKKYHDDDINHRNFNKKNIKEIIIFFFLTVFSVESYYFR